MTDPIQFDDWYDKFNRFSGDLYPGRYTRDFVRDLVEQGREVAALAKQKDSVIVAHNYQYPELQEAAVEVGDSLGLSQFVGRQSKPRVDFCGVWFMGETAKTIVGDRARVYMPAQPGCSLVQSIDHARIESWRRQNPDGLIISYVNTDARTKAMSDYVCTSRNAAQVVRHAADHNPGKRMLFLPDKYLGAVSLAQSKVDADLVDLYDGGCHVHAKIGESALDEAYERHPEAELLIHPECGCASTCLAKIMNHESEFSRAFYLSTEQMIHHAAASEAREFIVGTEMGMLYRLRKDVPHKIFHPVHPEAMCEYMKENDLAKLLYSLRHDEIEVLIDEPTRRKAQAAIDRMLTIQ
ncbi:MAG: quinolinate synthase NadA [Acidobacteria bacterium]|nr:quinolinate synthase NadA [Acidobacteriota bacterium]